MPLGGIFIVIFTGWFFGKWNLQLELSNGGRLKNGVFLNVFLIITRFVSPVLIALVFLNAIGILKI
jgi:NSS family neurotransmitter:Na+ symporter